MSVSFSPTLVGVRDIFRAQLTTTQRFLSLANRFSTRIRKHSLKARKKAEAMVRPTMISTGKKPRAATKAPVKTPIKVPAKAARKRKSDEDEGPLPPKKARITKQPAAARPKIIINRAPTQRLDVFVFGEGSSSELGLGTAKNAIDVKRPRLNPLLSSRDVGIVQIATGGMHVAALTHDNKILTWGVNDNGALGRDTEWEGGLKDVDDIDSDDSDNSDSGLNPKEANPIQVPASNFPEGTVFTKLSAGDSHTLALTDEGLVYGWGCFRVSSPRRKLIRNDANSHSTENRWHLRLSTMRGCSYRAEISSPPTQPQEYHRYLQWRQPCNGHR